MNGNSERERRQCIFANIVAECLLLPEKQELPKYKDRKVQFLRDIFTNDQHRADVQNDSSSQWYIRQKKALNKLADLKIGIEAEYHELSDGTEIYLRDARLQESVDVSKDSFEAWAIMGLSDFQIAEQIIRDSDLDKFKKAAFCHELRVKAEVFLAYIANPENSDTDILLSISESDVSVSEADINIRQSARDSMHQVVQAAATHTENNTDEPKSSQQIAYTAIHSLIIPSMSKALNISQNSAARSIKKLKDLGNMETPPCPMVTLLKPKQSNPDKKTFAQVDVPICYLTEEQQRDYVKILMYAQTKDCRITIPDHLVALQKEILRDYPKDASGKRNIIIRKFLPKWYCAIKDETTKAMVVHYLPKLLEDKNPSGLPTQLIGLLPGLRNAGEERLYMMQQEKNAGDIKVIEQNRLFHAGSMGQDTKASFDENVRLTMENMRAFHEAQGNPSKVRINSYISPNLATLPYMAIPLSLAAVVAMPVLLIGDLLSRGKFSEAVLPSAVLPKQLPKGLLRIPFYIAGMALLPVAAVAATFLAPFLHWAGKLPAQNERYLYKVQKEAAKRLNKEEKFEVVYANTPLDLTRALGWFREDAVENDILLDAKAKIAALIDKNNAETDSILGEAADNVLSPALKKQIENAVKQAVKNKPEGISLEDAKIRLSALSADTTLTEENISDNHAILFQHMVELQRLKQWTLSSFTLGQQNSAQRAVKASQMQSLITAIETNDGEKPEEAKSALIKGCKSGKDREGLEETLEAIDIVGRNLDTVVGRSSQLSNIQSDSGRLHSAADCIIKGFHTLMRAGTNSGSMGNWGFKNDGFMFPVFLILKEEWKKMMVTKTASANKDVKQDKKISNEEKNDIQVGMEGNYTEKRHENGRDSSMTVRPSFLWTTREVPKKDDVGFSTFVKNCCNF